MAPVSASEPATSGALLPVAYRVTGRTRETMDTWTLELEPVGTEIVPRPGQFAMLSVPGVGEVPISTSGLPQADGVLTHTVRAVGAVTARLCATEPGGFVGVRGPFGTTWPLERAVGRDLLLVAGGIGLAPLRPAVLDVLAHRGDYRVVTVLVGARTPGDLLYREELEGWRREGAIDVLVTVDAAGSEWGGRVGVVTTILSEAAYEPRHTTAFVCGPEIMMTLTARALVLRGVLREQVWISTERAMECGVGHCGHCQLGPFLICRDGPVFRLDAIERFTEVRQL
jgi:NAD(P)H-flavin reductase